MSEFNQNGFYIKDGKAEVDIPEMLRSMNLPDTEENRDLCVEVAEKVFREMGMITETTNVGHTHHHNCARCNSKWIHNGKKTKCILPVYSVCQSCKN